MPIYRYSAIDPRGTTAEGTIDATTPYEAMRQLTQSGLVKPRILSIVNQSPPLLREAEERGVGGRGQSNTQRTTYNTSAKPVVSPPKSAIRNPQSAIIRTRKSTDRDLLFLFAQAS